MIYFTRNGKTVTIKIDSNLKSDEGKGNWHTHFSAQLSGELAAILYHKHYEKEFEKRIVSIRQKEYEAGWKDAKSKKKKKQYFFSDLINKAIY